MFARFRAMSNIQTHHRVGVATALRGVRRRGVAGDGFGQLVEFIAAGFQTHHVAIECGQILQQITSAELRFVTNTSRCRYRIVQTSSWVLSECLVSQLPVEPAALNPVIQNVALLRFSLLPFFFALTEKPLQACSLLKVSRLSRCCDSSVDAARCFHNVLECVRGLP